MNGRAARIHGFDRAGAACAGTALVLAITITAVAADRPRVVVRPSTSDELLANPGIGWETFNRPAAGDHNLPEGIPSTIQYIRWGWSELQPRADSIDERVIDAAIASSVASGQQLAFRVKCCSPRRDHGDVPEWLERGGGRIRMADYGGGPCEIPVPDFDDPTTLGRHIDFIRRLGKRYDGHPAIVSIDIGSVGWWGEWHFSRSGNVRMPSPANLGRLVDAYLAAFPSTPLVIPIGAGVDAERATGRGAGWRFDSLGDLGSFAAHWNHMRDSYPAAIKRHRLSEAWRQARVSSEPPRNLDEFVARKWPVRSIFNYGLALHCSSFNGKSAAVPTDPSFREELRRFLRRLGYRFILDELSHPARCRPGDMLPVSMTWRNVGSAPCYRPYRLAIRLTDHGGRHVVFPNKSTVKSWFPGTVDLFATDYLHAAPDLPPGPPNAMNERLGVPADIAAGPCTLAVAVVGSDDETPVIRLAMTGRADDGWYPVSTVRIEP
jgi:hypothetical protein